MKKILEIFAQKMVFIDSLNYSMIILGTDQNLDLLKMSQHQTTEKVLDMCLEYKMISSIYRPTRVTHSSVTLIDNKYINSQLPFYSHIY